MKTIFPETAVILGIPIDNLRLEQIIDRMFKMAADYETDGRPRTAVAVDLNTVVRLYSGSRRNEDYEEAIVNALRQADLMIPTGRPVAWIARLVGTRLKEKFSGYRFFTKFLNTAQLSGKNLFILGDDSGDIKRAVEAIRSVRPELKIAGTADFDSSRAGKNSYRTWLLEKINSAAADFLILDLRDPAIACWFEKYRYRLYVPLSLVIPDISRFIKAEGKSFQKNRGIGHRIASMIPGFPPYIAKNFFYSSLLFCFTIFPLTMYQQYKRLSYRLFRIRSPLPSIKSRVSKSGKGIALRIITLPDPLDASMAEEIRDELKELVARAPKTVLDFSGVNFIDSSGLGLLLSLWRTAASKDREVFMIGIRPPVFRFFSLSRTLDFFEKNMCESIDDVIGVLSRRSDSSSFYYLAAIRGNAAIFHMYGELDASRVKDINVNSVLETIGRRNAVLNLSGLDFIDSAGMQFFVRIQRHVTRRGRCCIMYGLREYVRQMFTILKLDRMFVIADDLDEAETALENQL
ncbi:MAG: STAS domain-containing protein [Desulfobacteraceae bacterium]|nr:STAS domain-containing protein [Desulfobacteraceae bacterium]